MMGGAAIEALRRVHAALDAGADEVAVQAALGEARAAVEAADDDEHLRGELLVARARAADPDLMQVLPLLREALALLKGRSRTAPPETALVHGSAPFIAYHRVCGAADKEIRQLAEAVKLNRQLTGGGAGVLEMFEAFLAYFRGQVERAVDLAAPVFGAPHRSEDTSAGRFVTLPRIAAAELLCLAERHGIGDAGRATRYLREVAGGGYGSSPIYCRFADVARSSVLLFSGLLVNVPNATADGEYGVVVTDDLSGLRSVRGPHAPLLALITMLMHLQRLVCAGRPVEALNTASLMRGLCGGKGTGRPAADVYVHLWSAVAYRWLGDTPRAEASLDRAVKLCAQDGLWLILAEFDAELPIRRCLQQAGLNEGAQIAERVAVNYGAQVGVCHRHMLERELGTRLTPREASVLSLAIGNLTNAEIGARLCITEHTVKGHLTNAYAKLGLHGREDLRLHFGTTEILAFWAKGFAR